MQDDRTNDAAETTNEESSGLLLSVEPLATARDRHQGHGQTDDTSADNYLFPEG